MPRRTSRGSMFSRAANGMNPMEMCRMMRERRAQTAQPDLATEELRGLFFEWLDQVLEELKTLKQNPAEICAADIQQHLGVSPKSADWLLGRLRGEER